jgi:hypothetical protein
MSITAEIQKECLIIKGKELAKQYKPWENTAQYSLFMEEFHKTYQLLKTRIFELERPETVTPQEIPVSAFDITNLTSLNIQDTATEPIVLKDFFGEFC